ncbi:MAG: hypothetical protein KDD52_00615 [Bdellovibrionales bacterium]|nr:hypothetical protein [Bdellovibrionales bacterium]
MLSHGWSSLAPFVLEKDYTSITFPLRSKNSAQVLTVSSYKNGVIAESPRALDAHSISSVEKIFGFNQKLKSFYTLAKKHRRPWIVKAKMGRLMTAQTVFEDLIKLILTTNCSWSFTKKMVQNLCTFAGEEVQGLFLFPTPDLLAKKKASFFSDHIRCGYRGPYISRISKMVASGDIDPEAWLSSKGSAKDLKKHLLSLPGVGPYVAENMMRFLGYYEGLATDSWVRGQLQSMWKLQQLPSDAKIRSEYEIFDPYQGLMLWCDVTQTWLQSEISTRATKV